MTTLRHVAQLAAVSAMVVATVQGSAAPAAALPPLGQPIATILNPNLVIGAKLNVHGENWPQGTVSVQICGNLAVNGTADCDVEGTRGFGVGSSHKFDGRIVVDAPPAPCPCVLLVGSQFDAQTVLIPVTIKDHPIVAGTPVADPNQGLTNLSLTADITRGPWWRDAVGVSPERLLTLTISNTGGSPTGAGVVDVTVGKTSPAAGFAASIPFKSIDAGETTTVQAKFAVDSFAYGTYNITARVTSPAAGAEITKQTSTFPGWLLLAIIIIILIADLFWVRHVRKRKREREEAELAAIAAAQAAEEAAKNPPVELESNTFAAPIPTAASMNGDGEHRVRDDEAASVADFLVSVGVSAEVVAAVRNGGYRKPDAPAEPTSWAPPPDVPGEVQTPADVETSADVEAHTDEPTE